MLRVLIVDDDSISLRFLESALQQLDCATVGAADLTGALAASADLRFDLLLLDRNLPSSSGVELLATLRDRGIDAPAIATSAELNSSIRSLLLSAGFVACIEKPVTLAQLREILRPWRHDTDIPALDDAKGLAAIGGDRPSLQALRSMLADELSTLRDDMLRDAIEKNLLLDRLHRLRASCGFCGAPKLAAAAAALEQALRSHAGDASDRHHNFIVCAAETITALSL
jgi:CheY-like chemotaxis protein